MFSYYGSKSKVIDLYPAPRYGKIIEPFAGSARYALKYWDRDVLLVDKYEVIIKVWHYLQQASPADIMGLPEPKYKQTLDEFTLSEGERLLLSFLVARGVAISQYVVQQFSDIADAKKQIVESLEKIRRWEIRLGDYSEVPNQEATWFIDPPYSEMGYKYKYNNKKIDYKMLSSWCQSRQGQVIVCEDSKANWLPFSPIGRLGGAYSQTTEAIWCNDVQQMELAL